MLRNWHYFVALNNNDDSCNIHMHISYTDSFIRSNHISSNAFEFLMSWTYYHRCDMYKFIQNSKQTTSLFVEQNKLDGFCLELFETHTRTHTCRSICTTPNERHTNYSTKKKRNVLSTQKYQIHMTMHGISLISRWIWYSRVWNLVGCISNGYIRLKLLPFYCCIATTLKCHSRSFHCVKFQNKAIDDYGMWYRRISSYNVAFMYVFVYVVCVNVFLYMVLCGTHQLNPEI